MKKKKGPSNGFGGAFWVILESKEKPKASPRAGEECFGICSPGCLGPWGWTWHSGLEPLDNLPQKGAIPTKAWRTGRVGIGSRGGLVRPLTDVKDPWQVGQKRPKKPQGERLVFNRVKSGWTDGETKGGKKLVANVTKKKEKKLVYGTGCQ